MKKYSSTILLSRFFLATSLSVLTLPLGLPAAHAAEGRVSAIGSQLNFNFKIADVPVSLKAKYIFEFDTHNHVEGDGGLIQLAIPLGGG